MASKGSTILLPRHPNHPCDLKCSAPWGVGILFCLAFLPVLFAGCSKINPVGPSGSNASSLQAADFGDIFYQFHAQWGSYGSGQGQFNSPRAIASSGDDYIYVADAFNHRVQKFDVSGKFISSFTMNGNATPVGVALDSSSFVYVSALGVSGNYVQIYKNGLFIGQVGTQSGDGKLVDPRGVAVHGNYLFVVDREERCIRKYRTTGEFIQKWGAYGTGPGKFIGPSGIAADGAGNLYVTDDSDRVQKFDGNGIFLNSWGNSGSAVGQFRNPTGIAVDSAGNFFVADLSNSRVQKFNASGALTQWGNYGSAAGQFMYPVGIALDKKGCVYVSEIGNNRIQKFRPFFWHR